MTYLVKTQLKEDLPDDWDIRRLKELADVFPSNVDKLTVEGQSAVRLCNYVDAYKNEKITSQIEFMVATATPTQIERLALRTGDVAITKDSESPWDIAVPAYVAEDIEGLVCGYHLSKISPDRERLHGSYLAWALRCKPVSVQFSLSAQGITRYGLSSSALADGHIPHPPMKVQDAIAKYLDVETARIDALVEEKKGLLKLLDSLRESVIQEETSGAAYKGPTRATGHAFLPNVPTAWGHLRIGHVARVGNGSTPSRQNEAYWLDGTFPWLNSSVVNHDEVVDGSELITELALRECHLPRVKPGTVVMAMIGQGRTRGKVAVVRIEATLSQNIAFIEPNPEVLDGDYLFWHLTGAYRQIRHISDGRGGNQSALNCEDIARLMIPLPSLDAQREIVRSLKIWCARLDELVTHVNKEIKLLHDLRGATITDAVLGRIDVSHYMKT